MTQKLRSIERKLTEPLAKEVAKLFSAKRRKAMLKKVCRSIFQNRLFSRDVNLDLRKLN